MCYDEPHPQVGDSTNPRKRKNEEMLKTKSGNWLKKRNERKGIVHTSSAAAAATSSTTDAATTTLSPLSLTGTTDLVRIGAAEEEEPRAGSAAAAMVATVWEL